MIAFNCGSIFCRSFLYEKSVFMKSNDLTQGNITRHLISFALPLLAGALIQQLYSTVDMMFVGRVLGTSAAAAVGASGMIVTCIVGFFTGLSVGVGVVVGKSVGRRDENLLFRVIHCAAGLTLIMGITLLLLGVALAPTLLDWMAVPADIFPEATTYIRIYLCSILSIVIYNVGAGILKALGDSQTPTLYQLIGGIANVVGNYLFIVVLEWGVSGAAMTTLLSQTLAAGLTVFRLFRLPEGYRLRVSAIRLEGKLCGEILGIGIPSAIQAIMISLSNVIVQTSINRLDVLSIAAFTAYYKVENIIYYPIMAVGQTCSAFVSQNIGARQIGRARAGTQKSLLLGVGVTACISAITILGAPFAFSLFSKDRGVILLGSQIARVACPFYFLYAFLEVYAASIRGAGKAIPTIVITIFNMCFIRIGALAVLMNVFHSAIGVAAVYPITWLCTAICMYGYYHTGRWMPKELDAGEHIR